MKLRYVLGLTCALVALIPATSAQAANGNSFSGSCKFNGDVLFDRGVTSAASQNTFDFQLSGSCNGDANGSRVSSANSILTIKGSGVFGCLGSRGDMGANAVLTVGGRQIPLNASVKLSGLRFVLRFSGEGGGQAGGSGQAINDRFNAPSMRGCAGAGQLKKVAVALPDFNTRGDTLRAKDTGSSTPGKPSVKITVARAQHSKGVAKRGYVSVKCRPSSGRCKVRVLRGKTLIASGSGTSTVRAKLTKAGRRALRSKRFTAIVTARAGGAKVVRTVTFSR